MASTIAKDNELSVYIFYEWEKDGLPTVTKLKYFKNGREEGRFLSSSTLPATDRAKQEFEAYLDDPEIAEEGNRYMALVGDALRKIEDKVRTLR